MDIMNIVKYKTNQLKAFLQKKIIATMPEMKEALGTTVPAAPIVQWSGGWIRPCSR